MARPKKKGRRGRPSALARLTVADLMREVERRRGTMSDLIAQRENLMAELDSVSAEIAELESIGGGGGGGAAVSAPAPARRGRPPKSDGRRGGRGGNTQSLAMALNKILQGRTLGVAEMSEAVQKAGYKTKSPNFRTIVNAALLAKANSGLFKRVGRGQYTAK